ncbi:hypothetical protein J6590_007939 [Homalodisca vitripennis]|nr:hypothetical protein J6590_007939 [Homalodisca vitripennis]
MFTDARFGSKLKRREAEDWDYHYRLVEESRAVVGNITFGQIAMKGQCPEKISAVQKRPVGLSICCSPLYEARSFDRQMLSVDHIISVNLSLRPARLFFSLGLSSDSSSSFV